MGCLREKRYLVLILLILLAKSAPAAIHVKYVSSENVYLDAGSADSLIVGDRLSIGEIDTARIAIVEVTYAFRALRPMHNN